LASQAAISLESARLYSELRDHEAKIGVWSTQISSGSIFGMWKGTSSMPTTRFSIWWATTVNFSDPRHTLDRNDPTRVARNDARVLAELHVKGTAPLFEKELFRKEGSRVPILGGAALFEAGGTEGVAFVLDLSEQKRAEAEIRG